MNASPLYWCFKVLVSLSIMVLSVGGGVAQAPPSSGPCPPGAVPIPGQGRCGSPAEAAGINSRGAGNAAPAYTEIWENRFGAIARDFSSNAGGVVENQKSKRSAEREAIRRCGNKSCEIVLSVRNQCQAAVWRLGMSAFGNGNTEADAVGMAMERCKQGGEGCEVQYSGCSLPVRVR